MEHRVKRAQVSINIADTQKFDFDCNSPEDFDLILETLEYARKKVGHMKSCYEQEVRERIDLSDPDG